MLRITAGDGQHAMQTLMTEGNHGGGADLLALLGAKQEVQLMLAQGAADGLAFGQQAANRGLGIAAADPATHRHRVVAEQDQADKGHLEILAQAVFDGDHRFFQAGGVHQGQDQAASLVEQAVVVAGHIHQLREPMAHFDIALAQDLHLPLHQRHGIAALVGNTQGRQQFFVFNEEVRVSLQIRRNGCGLQTFAWGCLRGYLRLISH
eukprot:gene9954-biopygen9956